MTFKVGDKVAWKNGVGHLQCEVLIAAPDKCGLLVACDNDGVYVLLSERELTAVPEEYELAGVVFVAAGPARLIKHREWYLDVYERPDVSEGDLSDEYIPLKPIRIIAP